MKDKKVMDNVQNLVYKMLIENTGIHFLDSGGSDGRHWQRNQLKSIDDFINEPIISYEIWNNSNDNVAKLDDISITVSLFHYLSDIFELDDVCNEFNSKFNVMSDYESDYNFISSDAQNWLDNNGFELQGTKENTYNYDNYFSQGVLYTHLKLNDDTYYLVSIHNGADARGGYTDAKLFKLPFHTDYAFCGVTVTGVVAGVGVSNQDNGVTLNIDDDNFDGLSDDFTFPKDCEIGLDYHF
jgi:hypothetical protein